MKTDIDAVHGIMPTTYGLGPFHPAISTNAGVWYWPNITYPTEEEAYLRAAEIVDDAIAQLQATVHGWNIAKAGG